MTTETKPPTVRDERIEWIRGELDFIQSKMDVIGPILGKKYIRKHLTTWREGLTIWKKKMPRVPALYAFLTQPSFNVRELVKMIEYPSSYREMSIQKMRYVLEMPERYRDSFDDMQKEQPMAEAKYRSKMLKERQDAIGDPNPLIQQQATLTEKEVKRAYKKYVKEWSKYD